MDWQSLLYAPIYSVLGVPAVLTLDDTAGTTLDDLTVIDGTSGTEVGFKGADVLTIRPTATVKAPDLATIDLADLRDATIAFNGKTWTIVDHMPIPAPTGEGQGEIRLILETA